MDLIARSITRAQDSDYRWSMKAEDVAALIASPHAGICSDGTSTSLHPRGRGAFTKVLRLFVRDQKLLSFEEAIRKMTGLSARISGSRNAASYALVLRRPRAAGSGERSRPFDVAGSARAFDGHGGRWVDGIVVSDGVKATRAYSGRTAQAMNRVVPKIPNPTISSVCVSWLDNRVHGGRLWQSGRKHPSRRRGPRSLDAAANGEGIATEVDRRHVLGTQF